MSEVGLQIQGRRQGQANDMKAATLRVGLRQIVGTSPARGRERARHTGDLEGGCLGDEPA